MLGRDNFANAIAVAQKPESGLLANVPALLAVSGVTPASTVVDGLTRLLVDGDFSNQSVQALYAYLGHSPNSSLDTTAQDAKVRGLLYLTLASPEYNLN
jgi:hypothetical protein